MVASLEDTTSQASSRPTTEALASWWKKWKEWIFIIIIILISAFIIIVWLSGGFSNQAYCPALTSNTTTIACFSGGDEEVSCAHPQSIGSWADLACKPGYAIKKDYRYDRILCTSLGKWDREVFACHPNVTSCPALASNTATIACYSKGRAVNCSRSQAIGSWAVLSCKPGYTTSKDVAYRRINCTDSAEWDPPVFACRPNVTSCPAPASNMTVITYSCYSLGQEVNCSRPQEIGSWAVGTCKPGYWPTNTENNGWIQCTEMGTWAPPVFACHPDCGRRNTIEGEPQIVGGVTARVGEFPWHVAIYEQAKDSQAKDSQAKDSFMQICGGSLVTTLIVISAAHCFWNEQYTRKKNSTFAVAAGKFKRAWLDAEDDDQVQRRLVEFIMTHQWYHGRKASFQADIAIVRLSAPVDITPNVNLVCVDWENRWEETQLQGTNKGTFPGWGYTDELVLSKDLKHVDLPYVDHDTCYNALSDPLKPLLTTDKFCAGYDNHKISTCRGDSGGGLVFLNESSNRYYLRGVVSIAFKPASSQDLCYSESYTAYTRVSQYRQWMKIRGVQCKTQDGEMSLC